MKIVQFVPYMDRSEGGPPEVVRQFSRGLTARGHQVHVCFTGSPPLDGDRVAGVHYRALSGRGGIRALSASTRKLLVGILEGADRVLLHTAWQPLHAAVRQVCLRQGIPYAYMPHGMLDQYCLRQKPARKRAYLMLLERKLIRDAQCILLTSEGERRQSAAALGKKHAPVAIVPLGVEAPESRLKSLPQNVGGASAPMPAPDMKPGVVFLGRLHPKKGLERLLHAWALWKDRPEEVKLRIAGRGERAYERKLLRLSTKLGIRDSVVFLGERYGEEKWRLLASSPVFVLPSYQENFGLAVAEALCAGCRAVVGEGVNIADDAKALGGAVVTEGEGFSQRFAEAMAQSWAAGAEGRQEQAGRAKQKYDWVASVDALLAALGR